MAKYLFFLLFLTSCGEKAPKGIYISSVSGFSSLEEEKINQTFSLLNASAPETYLTASSGDRAIVIVRENNNSTSFSEIETRYYSCKITLNLNNHIFTQDLNNIKYVLAHKLAQCVGIPYSADVNSLMYPNFSGIYDASAEAKITDISPMIYQKSR